MLSTLTPDLLILQQQPTGVAGNQRVSTCQHGVVRTGVMVAGQMLPIGAPTSSFSSRIVALLVHAPCFRLMRIKVHDMSREIVPSKMPGLVEPALRGRDVGQGK